MYLDKVKMRFAIDQGHCSLMLFFAIVVINPMELRGGQRLSFLHSQMSYLLQLLSTLGSVCLFTQNTNKIPFI